MSVVQANLDLKMNENRFPKLPFDWFRADILKHSIVDLTSFTVRVKHSKKF